MQVEKSVHDLSLQSSIPVYHTITLSLQDVCGMGRIVSRILVHIWVDVCMDMILHTMIKLPLIVRGTEHMLQEQFEQLQTMEQV